MCWLRGSTPVVFFFLNKIVNHVITDTWTHCWLFTHQQWSIWAQMVNFPAILFRGQNVYLDVPVQLNKTNPQNIQALSASMQHVISFSKIYRYCLHKCFWYKSEWVSWSNTAFFPTSVSLSNKYASTSM
jgi:hypothetical protein